MNALVTMAIFATVFALIFRGSYDRRAVVLCGAGAMLAFGMLAGFYTPQMAVKAVYFETLALIFGMSLISAMLARSGLFVWIARRAAARSRGNGWWVLVIFTLATYGLSLMINNLSAMVVILPVTLSLCWHIGANPVPILIAEIIASNLGGASTMVGDFPNMIISSAGDLHFIDFIGSMMVPCLILLAAMLAYFNHRRGEIQLNGGKALPEDDFLDDDEVPQAAVDSYLLKLGLVILGATLIGFFASDFINIRPAWIAFWAGVIVLALGQFDTQDLFDAAGVGDMLFFAGLFIMVGALDAARVLDGFYWLIEAVSFGYDLPRLWALMVIAAVAAIFLNAGAATAFLIPVACDIYDTLRDPAVWWALSLGILAGSSAALTGATAGSVAASHFDRFLVAHPQMRAYCGGQALDFKGYLSWGLPIMGIFLGLSGVYIALVIQ